MEDGDGDVYDLGSALPPAIWHRIAVAGEGEGEGEAERVLPPQRNGDSQIMASLQR